jgi:deazaflavin-dependent oxidoreductase (nitroreductase family)
MTTTHSTSRSRPLFGLRTRPGRLALAVMHLPLRAYAHGQGHLLGHAFLHVTHVGRTSGTEYRSVAMVLSEDQATGEAVICSAWDSDWYANLLAHAATSVTLGRRTFTPVQRFLDDDEAEEVVRAFRAAHPLRARLVTSVLGWGDLADDERVREFVRTHPFVAFRPANS